MSYIGNQPTSLAFVTDQFSGTGSQTAFTMSVAPANASSVLVAVTGVLQDPSTYSVSGTTLTFSAAPPSGTGNISVRYLGIPASGVTTTAYRTVTNFTATAGQTTFTPPSYTAGYIDVYRNGSKLALADFTATNGTTVVLATGASAGDVIETDSFYVSSVLNAMPYTAGIVTPAYMSGNAPQVTAYSSGSGTYTTPANCKALFIRMVAAGGGGGAGNSTTWGGGGGNSGAYLEALISSPSATYAYSVGAGGAGGVNAASGSAGGNTTFGASLTCQGGAGGAWSGASSTPTNTATGGYMNINGVAGQSATYSGSQTAAGGNGASSPLGSGGGGGAPGSGVGYAGAYGGGGGGSGQLASTTGGAGGSGLIIVTAYF